MIEPKIRLLGVADVQDFRNIRLKTWFQNLRCGTSCTERGHGISRRNIDGVNPSLRLFV